MTPSRKSDDVTVTYGHLEMIPGEFEEYAIPVGIFSRTLKIEQRPVVGHKRFEVWTDEQGRKMGRWTWERAA